MRISRFTYAILTIPAVFRGFTGIARGGGRGPRPRRRGRRKPGHQTLHPDGGRGILRMIMRWQTLYEARWIFAVLALAAGFSFFFVSWAGWLFVGLMGFTLHFFRDPERGIPEDPRDIVAPADGTVADVIDGASAPAGYLPLRIGIFLSVLDVHVNRAPIAGSVVSTEQRNGRYLDARHPDASALNAFRNWIFEGEAHRVAVRQITGAIARRIVPWSRPGDVLAKGHRFGMIRFGSRTELFLPPGCEILVEPGQRVKGGSTVVARFPGEDRR